MSSLAQPSAYLAWGKNGDPKITDITKITKKVKKESIGIEVVHCGHK
ncbi:hypothetical protein MUO69_02175 [Candidatus Bathyarchaeota archaeon]|nr:hypothetical protein [Candidatus Bathyarchaeota archaeon]